MAEKKTAVTDKTPRKPGRDEPALRPVKAASRMRLAVPPADGAWFNRFIAHSLNNLLPISRGNLTLLRCVTKDRDSIEMIDDALPSLNDAKSLSSSLTSLGNGTSFAPVNVEKPKFLLQLANSLGKDPASDDSGRMRAAGAGCVKPVRDHHDPAAGRDRPRGPSL